MGFWRVWPRGEGAKKRTMPALCVFSGVASASGMMESFSPAVKTMWSMLFAALGVEMLDVGFDGGGGEVAGVAGYATLD